MAPGDTVVHTGQQLFRLWKARLTEVRGKGHYSSWALHGQSLGSCQAKNEPRWDLKNHFKFQNLSGGNPKTSLLISCRSQSYKKHELITPVEIVTKFKRQQITHFPRTPQKAELFWVFCERNWRHQRILLWLRCLDKRNKLPDRIHSTSYLSDRSDHFKKQDLVKEKISAYLHISGWRIKVVPILLGNPHSSGLCQIAITYNGHHCH